MTMKKIIWMQAVLLTGLAAMWGCGGDDTTDEQPAVMPQVTFPVTESAVSAYVDDAVRFDKITYLDVIARELNVMDSTAITLCNDNSMPILVFNLEKEGNIDAALRGEAVGTVVYRED